MGATTVSRSAESTRTGRWVAVGVLTASTFLVVTSEMLPVGVLTPMAEGLSISDGATGTSLTVTGLVSAVTAPLVPRLLGDLDRRLVLASAMLVLAAGNVLTATAGGFVGLVGARVVLGIGMGVVWGLASAVAARLVATRSAALAVSFAVSGVATASVLGVPLGTVVGDAFGWRAAFGLLAAVAVVLALLLVLTFPRLGRPEADTGGPDDARRSLARPAVLVGLGVVVLLVTAHFAAYTYVRPVLEDRAGLSTPTVALLLLLYGAFGLVGNFVAGAAAARGPRWTVTALAVGIAAAVALLAAAGTVTAIVVAAVALWGLAYGGLSVGAQLWMTSVAPDRVEHVTGLYVGVFTASIAAGAAIGGLVVEQTGLTVLLWVTAATAAASVVVATLPTGSRTRVGTASGDGR